MVVKFDKFNNVEDPQLILCSPGSKYSSGDISQAFGELVNVSDIEMQLNFNSTSSLDFRLYDVPDEDGEKLHELFEKVEERMYIYVPDIGYFVIRECPRTSELGAIYKDVSATSCDIEFSNRLIPYIDGTYPLITEGNDVGIINLLIANTPQWTLGHVDEELEGVYRSFTDLDDANMYAFIIDNIQKAYECIVVFDIVSRVVNVYTRENYVTHTSIYLTENDLVKKIKQQSSADDIYTALRVSGEDDIGIARVNPVGGNVIYNYDYYLSWMPAELAAKVEAWEQAIVDNDAAYTLHSLAYYELREQESDTVLEIQRLTILINTYSQCKQNIIDTSSTDGVAAYNVVIEANGGTPITIMETIQQTIDEIDGFISDATGDKGDEEDELADIRDDITEENDALELIRATTVPSRVFTQAELQELSLYTFEGNYKDEYIKITESMDQEDQFAQIRTMYSRGIDTLKSVSKPVYKFEIDTESFQFIAGYDDWTEELVQGCSIYVEVRPDSPIELFLSGIRLNYEEKSVKLTFGSIIDRNDLKSLFEDVLGTIKKSANSVSYI